jgi:hypothetical protein
MKALIVLLLVCSTLAVAKSRNWQDAVVYKMGSANGGAVAAPIGTAVIAIPITYLHYFVETSDLKIELVTERNLNITLNKKTQVALEGNKAYLVDDSGKERRLRVVQKVAK